MLFFLGFLFRFTGSKKYLDLTEDETKRHSYFSNQKIKKSNEKRDFHIFLKTADFTFDTEYTEKPTVGINYANYYASNCLFDSCKSTGNGGAIEIQFSSKTLTFTVNYSSFYHCKSQKNGGAISSFSPKTTVKLICCYNCSATSLGNFIFCASTKESIFSYSTLAVVQGESSGSGSLYMESGKQTINNINSSYCSVLSEVSGIILLPSSIYQIGYMMHAYNKGQHTFGIQPKASSAKVSNLITFNSSSFITYPLLSILYLENAITFSSCYFIEFTNYIVNFTDAGGSVAFDGCVSTIEMYGYNIPVVQERSYPEFSYVNTGLCYINLQTATVSPETTIVYVDKSTTGWLIAVIILSVLLFILIAFNVAYFFIVPYINKKREEEQKKKEKNNNNENEKQQNDPENPATNEDKKDKKQKDGSLYYEEEEEEEKKEKKESKPIVKEATKNGKKKDKSSDDEYYEEEDISLSKKKPIKKPKQPMNKKNDINWDDDTEEEEEEEKKPAPKKPRSPQKKQKQEIKWEDDEEEEKEERKEPVKPNKSQKSSPKKPLELEDLSRGEKEKPKAPQKEANYNYAPPKQNTLERVKTKSEKDDSESSSDIQISQSISHRHKRRVKRVVKKPNNSGIDMSTSFTEDEHHKRRRVKKSTIQ